MNLQKGTLSPFTMPIFFFFFKLQKNPRKKIKKGTYTFRYVQCVVKIGILLNNSFDFNNFPITYLVYIKVVQIFRWVKNERNPPFKIPT